MPTWKNELPTESKHMGFDLRRTPSVGALHAICTSEDFVVCDTHFYHGRTAPCERARTVEGEAGKGFECAACNEGIPYRTHVYLSTYDAKKNEHFIFECTANAAKSLDEYRKATGSIRGCIIYASRPKGLKNSKVSIETNTANLSKIKLPTAPNLIQALSIIWRLPAPALDVKSNGKKRKELTTINNRIRNMDTQPDNMPDPPMIGDFLKEALTIL